ncbi:hypothetical protein MJM45_30975, partial [Salmonella enterica subsp. enterica serovar Kentucky]|nr:hypothetical protein [Salmonella enterica subsp. enterica serovar Kentucky]
LRDSFDALASAEKLPYSKPHPQVYLDCAAKLGVDPLTCVALDSWLTIHQPLSNFSIIRSIALALPLLHWHVVNIIFTFMASSLY